MEDICRLCCSPSFVNNNIFDEENALYLKMSLYLPIKVFKNDRLPQKVCDKCSCKVNDLYQFCNETIEVQERLRAVLVTNGIESEVMVDLTRIKENVSPIPIMKLEQCTQTDLETNDSDFTPTTNNVQPCVSSNLPNNIQIKEEPETLSPVKEESDADRNDYPAIFSDDSDDMSLLTIKKKKKTKNVNGVKKRGPKKKKLKEWEGLLNGLPDSTVIQKVNHVADVKCSVKEEVDQKPTVDVKVVKVEPSEMEVFHCCICFCQCFSRGDILQHYKQHAQESPQPTEAPPAPPPPDTDPLRCTRCRKNLQVSEWAGHWSRHWQRDRRPYRCALCEKSFRDAHQILKHGQTHKYGADADEEAAPANKRFVCDLCPEGFVYMRYLLAHRAGAHPDAAARALVLRCSVCARQFAHLNSLRRHLRAHSGERNHLCNVCGKALSSREHLKFHIRIHTGYKPNVCKTCGKGFVKKCNLTLHERVHSGEKPHVCASCGKAFSQRSTLVIHERYHSGARPYSCALCGRGFVAKGLLSMHLKTTCICKCSEWRLRVWRPASRQPGHVKTPPRSSISSAYVDFCIWPGKIAFQGSTSRSNSTLVVFVSVLFEPRSREHVSNLCIGGLHLFRRVHHVCPPKMSSAVEIIKPTRVSLVNGTNGHAGTNGTNGNIPTKAKIGSNGTHNGTNGIHDDAWEEQFLPPPLRLDDKIRSQKIEARLASLVLSGATLSHVAEVFEEEVERGLNQQPSSLQMENTYVPELPDGTEEGVFLALDLGGTNFRVLLLELKAGQLVREDVKHYHISDELRIGPGDDLFNFLADCVLDFLTSEGMKDDEFSLGFTFSFPMKQHSISSGELITWTKSFKCGGLAGVDVAALLQRCLTARGLRVTVRVLLNDTTGTLVSGALANREVGIGVILGTGSNGCYMERASRVTHWEAAHAQVRDVCVDVEWGAFGDNGCIDFIKTDIDREVDAKSLLVNSFMFEKCIGGKYLGSVLSIALAALARDGLFPAAPAHDALVTADLSLIEEENVSGGTERTLEVLRRALPGACAELGPADALCAQYVAQVISNRAAQLASVCISTLLRRMARPLVAVAVDGSVYKRHPRIASLMDKYIALLAPGCPFELLPAEDGSGKGSALTAAIAARIAARDS